MDRKNSIKIRKDKEQKPLKTEHEPNSSDVQTDQDLVKDFNEEVEQGSLNVSNRGKTKGNRKRKSYNFPDEDVIDGFLILSYGCLEDLEADGPIKPGATIAKKVRPGSPLSSIKKGKGKTIVKVKKGVPEKASKKNKENASRDVNLNSEDKPKKKSKKIKAENATITKPDTSVAEETEALETETKKDVAVSPLHVNEINEDLPMPLSLQNPPTPLSIELKPTLGKIADKIPPVEEAPKVFKDLMPKKTLSDFSIRAIQGIDTTPNSDGGTKSIATMTSENNQDKSVSPMKSVDRVPLSNSQYNKIPEKRLNSASSIISSPAKHGFPFPEKPTRESSYGGQFPRLKFTPSVSTAPQHKMSLLQGDDLGDGRQDRHSVPAMSPDLLRQETHQHQHQHIHQHQHQHQHFHPPYGTMPGHPYGPMVRKATDGLYYGPVSVMPVVPPGNHQGVPLHPLKKTGKWCALHVQIARFIDDTQKKIEKLGFHKPDPAPSLTPSNRSGSHAFQAVQPRSHGHQERELGHHFGGHFHSNLNTLPGQHHSNSLHSFVGRPPEKSGLLSHPLEPGHHLSSGLRHGSSARGADIPPFGFSGLTRPFERSQDHEPCSDRLSPFRPSRLTEIVPPAAPDFGSIGRSGSQTSLFLRRDTEGKIERERQHHLAHSFLDRDKPPFFRPSTFDPLERSTDIRTAGQSLAHSLPGAEFKRIGSPPLSKAVTTTQNILRTMNLFEKSFIDRPSDHPSIYHKDKGRDFGLFASRSRMPSITGAPGHSGLLSNLGLGSSRPHFSSS